MKEKQIKLVYFVYVISIVTLTLFSSLKILEKQRLTALASLIEESEEPKYTYHCSEWVNSTIFHLKIVPNCETLFDGLLVKLPITHIKTNSYGFRDYEYSIEKPNNTFRIVALGDSITWGHGVELEDSYTKVLERVLNEEAKGNLNYEVLNLGASGYNTREEVEFFKEVGMKFKPDLIMIQYNSDDIYDRVKIQKIYEELVTDYVKDKNMTNRNLPNSINNQLYTEATKMYEREIRAIEEKNFDEVWKIVEDPLSELNNISNKLGASVLIIIGEPVKMEHIPRLEKIVNKYGWGLVRADELFRKYEWSELTLDPKDNHPNAFAHRLIAEEINKKLIDDGFVHV